MHELSVTESILKTVLPIAEQNGVKRILEIRLRIGEYADIIPDCIQAYLDIIGEGTLAEGAKVVTELVPAVFSCTGCGFRGQIDRRLAKCPVCGNTGIKLLTGREFTVENLVAE